MELVIEFGVNCGPRTTVTSLPVNSFNLDFIGDSPMVRINVLFFRTSTVATRLRNEVDEQTTDSKVAAHYSEPRDNSCAHFQCDRVFCGHSWSLG
jgi:hypothetical protein